MSIFLKGSSFISRLLRTKQGPDCAFYIINVAYSCQIFFLTESKAQWPERIGPPHVTYLYQQSGLLTDVLD